MEDLDTVAGGGVVTASASARVAWSLEVGRGERAAAQRGGRTGRPVGERDALARARPWRQLAVSATADKSVGEPENTGNKSMTTALQVTNNGHTWGGECKSGDDNVRLEDKHSFPSMTFS